MVEFIWIDLQVFFQVGIEGASYIVYQIPCGVYFVSMGIELRVLVLVQMRIDLLSDLGLRVN
jgi:hypothetical protein